jgi:NADP-dependent 3-hydroxy acid dehydrogenase YdfG
MTDRTIDPPAAVVSGAGSGIGRAIALALGRRGHPLLLVGRRREPLEAALAECGGEGRIVLADVRDAKSVVGRLRDAETEGFVPTIAIPAAGVARVAPFEELSDEAFRESIDTNLLGALNLYRAVLPGARKRGGHLFAILSAAALRGFPSWVAYGASKWALRGAFEALREELEGSGIRTTAIYPGATATPLWNEVPGDWDRTKMISPEEVAKAVTFALDAAAAVPEIHLQPTGGDL